MTPDLSTQHAPITDLFPRLQGDETDAQFRLDAEQLAFYHENGYLPGVRILMDDQVDVLREQLAGLLNPDHEGSEYWHEYHTNESGDPNNVLFHSLGAWRIQPGFHDALWNPAFMIPASQLLNGPVRFWHDQLFCKPAHHGGVVAWHQDYSYWTRTQPMRHLTCWIGLDDATEDNGCLQYIPKSHHWELLPVTGLAHNMDAIQQVLTAEQKTAFKPVAVELKKGEASFHHPHMVHGSYENRTNRPRRAMVLNVFLDGVVSDTDETLLNGIPVIPKGVKMEGQFFPLLLDPTS
jgi:ectoine hydroxylase-related dioxygenase (phytanoyl-CoA dioxygenase family)